MASVKIMQWISLFLTTAIAGMGLAPIAEYYDLITLRDILFWIGAISAGALVIAGIFIGGIAIYHGYLVLMGKQVPTLNQKSELEL